jgi:hypothetical protein
MNCTHCKREMDSWRYKGRFWFSCEFCDLDVKEAWVHRGWCDLSLGGQGCTCDYGKAVVYR